MQLWRRFSGDHTADTIFEILPIVQEALVILSYRLGFAYLEVGIKIKEITKLQQNCCY